MKPGFSHRAATCCRKDLGFLNIPYDKQFENLYLAYIAGLTAFGLVPRATLEIPGGSRRLDRIFELIQTCGYSFHDLSRVERDRSKPKTPRFFELGLAVGCSKLAGRNDQVWFVLEAVDRRIQKSLSDLNGTDVYVHGGHIKGVLRALSNALVRNVNQPTLQQMMALYRKLRKAVPIILNNSGASSTFEARVFKDLVQLAASLSKDA